MSTFKNKKRKLPKVDPDASLLFDELCEVFRKIGVEIRFETGYFKGGICILEDQKILFVNKNNPIKQNIDVLVEQLKSADLENVYIPPRLRSKIEAIDINIEV